MTAPKIFDDISAKLSDLANSAPAKDFEKNAKAIMASAFNRMDLVTREEFDVQRELLARAQQKIADLEARLAQLEAANQDKG